MKYSLTELIKASQPNLKKMCVESLRESDYGNITVADGFVYAEGELPILLVAHLDTVHEIPKKIFSSNTMYGDILYSPTGIGGDDRCGVYMIMKIIEDFDLKPHILFTEDEEIGMVGASKFICSKIQPNVNFIMSFDRKGMNEAVFYQCQNKKFIKFITSFGLEKENSTFADISVLCPRLNIAGVNLSCGYYGAHTQQEIIVVEHMEKMVEIAIDIININNSIFFPYKVKP